MVYAHPGRHPWWNVKERTSHAVRRLPPRVASPGGTYVVMRLEELTLNSTYVRVRLALAQAPRILHLNVKSGHLLPTGFWPRESDALTQASPLLINKIRPQIQNVNGSTT